jgi:hypothetical protein
MIGAAQRLRRIQNLKHQLYDLPSFGVVRVKRQNQRVYAFHRDFRTEPIFGVVPYNSTPTR